MMIKQRSSVFFYYLYNFYYFIYFIIIIISSSSSSSKHNRDHSSNAKYSGWDSIFSIYFRMVCSSSHSGLLPPSKYS